MSKILSEVITDLKNREERGLKTYGTTVDRDDYTLVMWLQEAYEETLDQALYLKCAINKLNEKYANIPKESEGTDTRIKP